MRFSRYIKLAEISQQELDFFFTSVQETSFTSKTTLNGKINAVEAVKHKQVPNSQPSFCTDLHQKGKENKYLCKDSTIIPCTLFITRRNFIRFSFPRSMIMHHKLKKTFLQPHVRYLDDPYSLSTHRFVQQFIEMFFIFNLYHWVSCNLVETNRRN